MQRDDARPEAGGAGSGPIVPASPAELFLALNDFELLAGDVECVTTMLAVAAGQLDEAAFAAWLREHSAPR